MRGFIDLVLVFKGKMRLALKNIVKLIFNGGSEGNLGNSRGEGMKRDEKILLLLYRFRGKL